jgi:hypothetical protein
MSGMNKEIDLPPGWRPERPPASWFLNENVLQMCLGQ